MEREVAGQVVDFLSKLAEEEGDASFTLLSEISTSEFSRLMSWESRANHQHVLETLFDVKISNASPEILEVFLSLLPRMTSLMSLRISRTRFTAKHVELLQNGLTSLRGSLQHLTFSETQLEGQLLKLVCEEIQYLSNLTRLYLIGNKIDTIHSATSISSALYALSQYKKLTTLILTKNQISDEAFPPILDALVRHDLAKVDLSRNQLSKISDMVRLVTSVDCLHSLYVDANLYGMQGNDEFASLGMGICKASLVTISIAKNEINSGQFQRLLAGLSSLEHELRLDLSNNFIGDGLEELGKMLVKSKVNMERISLRGNSIPNSALSEFSKYILASKGGMKLLDLSKNNIPLQTGYLLLKACIDNNTGLYVDLSDNPDCDGLLREANAMKHRILSHEYDPYQLVTLAVLGKNTDDIEGFTNYFDKLRKNKSGSSSSVIQLDKSADKVAKDYLYSIHPYTRVDYVHFSGLLEYCFRVIHVVVEDIKNPDIISRLRSWVALINANGSSTKKITIIFAVLIDRSVTQETMDTTESRIHDLITEMGYLFHHIHIATYPLFIRDAPAKFLKKKDPFYISMFQSEVRNVVESFPVYLPRAMLEILLPTVKLAKAMSYSEFLDEVKEALMISDHEASTPVQKLFDTGVMFKLTEEFVITDPVWFHTTLIENFKVLLESGRIRAHSYCVNPLTIQSLSWNEECRSKAFFRGVCQLLTKTKIWFPVMEEDDFESHSSPHFFPPYCCGSVFSEERDVYEIGQKLDPNNACFLGRRIEAPLTETIAPRIWYFVQATLFKLLSQPQQGWTGHSGRDFVRYSHESGFEFRIYLHLKSCHQKTLRLIELHVAGPHMDGCVSLLLSMGAVLHSAYESFGLVRRANTVKPSLFRPRDVLRWHPAMIEQDLHLTDLYLLLKNCSEGKVEFGDGSSYRLLIPDILTISSHSVVDYRLEDDEVIVEVTIFDQNHVKHVALPQDEIQVMLLHPSGKKLLGKKEFAPNILFYSCKLEENDNVHEFLLLVTLPNRPIPLGNTPVYLSKDQSGPEAFKQNWKEMWEPAYECDFLSFFDPTDYLNSRNQVIQDVITSSLAEMEEEEDENIIRPAREDKLTEEDYLRICVDGMKLAQLAYVKELHEYVSKHCIQRELHNYNFFYLPNHKQKLKVFLFSPPVRISTMKTGKTSFYTFERAGDLYICIRGTKTGADIIADLKYKLTPYQENTQRPGRLTRIRNRVKGIPGEEEMIHEGFSMYADTIIMYFRDSYSEMLKNKEEKRRLIICGHSLGGGIAQVIARKMLEQDWKGQIIVVTYGSPLIGNNIYCNWEGWRNAPNLKIFNFANQKDPVTNLLVREWFVFNNLGIAPKLDFGYTGKVLYVFSCNTSTLEVIQHENVISYLSEQVAWRPDYLQKYCISHTGNYYFANVKKLWDDYQDPEKRDHFFLPE